MNPSTPVPYSTTLFPTLTKLCNVFDKDKKSVDILLKHENFDDFLDRIETTAKYYFQEKKIDCTYEEWEICSKKIKKLFLDKNDYDGRFKICTLNRRILNYFINLEYGVCNVAAESRFEGCFLQLSDMQSSEATKSIAKLAQLLQKILSELIKEAEELNLVPQWIEEHNMRLQNVAFLLNNAVVSAGTATLRVTPELFSDAQFLFNKYPGISFEKDKTTIVIKKIRESKVFKFENILKSIESKKTSESCNLIFSLAKASLIVSKVEKTSLSVIFNSKISKNITPFLYDEQIELSKLSSVNLFCLEENRICLENVKKIHNFWNLCKLKQEVFFDFCVEKLGDLIKGFGRPLMMFTHRCDQKGKITLYPGSTKILNEPSSKKFFNDMLMEHGIFKDTIRKAQIEENEYKSKQNKIIDNEIKKNIHEPIKSVDEINRTRKSDSQKIPKEKKIEGQTKKESFITKAKKVETCVTETMKVLTKPKPTVHTAITPSLFQMRMKSQPKTVSTNPQPKALCTGISFPGEPFPYKKDARVLRWEEIDFNTALTGEDFPDHNYSTLPDLDQKWVKIIHNPNEYIDNFAHMGLNELWHSREKNQEHPCISVLAEITYMNKSYRGVMQWTFNKGQTHLYHKCFKHEFEDNDPLKKKLKEFDYPRLFQHEQKIQYGSTLVTIRDNGTATLFDRKRDVTVKLLKA